MTSRIAVVLALLAGCGGENCDEPVRGACVSGNAPSRAALEETIDAAAVFWAPVSLEGWAIEFVDEQWVPCGGGPFPYGIGCTRRGKRSITISTLTPCGGLWVLMHEIGHVAAGDSHDGARWNELGAAADVYLYRERPDLCH